MDKKYLQECYEENKEKLLDSEMKIENLEEFKDYIIATIKSNLQYDFDLDIDVNKLFNSDITPSINIGVNNNRTLRVEQSETDKLRGGVALLGVDEHGKIDRRDLIDEGDFVMLMNYYYYVKDNDIKDDFINRDGTNSWTKFSHNGNDLDM